MDGLQGGLWDGLSDTPVRPSCTDCPAKVSGLSGLAASIVRPRCCGFTDGSGGFTDGLSDIAVSAFNVAVVRFCG